MAASDGSIDEHRKVIDTIPAVAHPLAREPTEIASNIIYHARYSPHFSPVKFELEQAYYATADSVRDLLVQVRFPLIQVLVFNPFMIKDNKNELPFIHFRFDVTK